MCIRDSSMTVHMTQVDATALLQFTLVVAPMHYYGDESLYDLSLIHI